MGMEDGRATDFLCSLAVDVFELGLAESQHCVCADLCGGCLVGLASLCSCAVTLLRVLCRECRSGWSSQCTGNLLSQQYRRCVVS
jgi:hypothetical protein